MNEIIFFASFLLCSSCVMLFYKLFGECGLYAWISLAAVFANIEVVKTVDIFGMQATLGNVLFGTIFACTDILNERYGYAASKRGVYIGFAAVLAYLMLSQICVLYRPGMDDFASESMSTIFRIAPRVCLTSVAMYLFSNLLDIRLFQAIKRRLPGDKWLWVRNNVATILSQCVENFLFTLGAFYGIYNMPLIINIAVTTCILETIIAVMDTPFIYLAKHIRPLDER